MMQYARRLDREGKIKNMEKEFIMNKVGFKKIAFTAIPLLIMAFASSASAGFYADVGIGLGSGSDELEGENAYDELNRISSVKEEMALNYGFKLGYGPFNNTPIYIVFELDHVEYEISGDFTYKCKSNLIGPGIVYYPTPIMQLGASFGYSALAEYSMNVRNGNSSTYLYQKGSGTAWNVSAAVELGSFLIGAKYFSATNDLDKTSKMPNVKQNTSMVGVFIKFVSRTLPESSSKDLGDAKQNEK
jgi:hypothetical protein